MLHNYILQMEALPPLVGRKAGQNQVGPEVHKVPPSGDISRKKDKGWGEEGGVELWAGYTGNPKDAAFKGVVSFPVKHLPASSMHLWVSPVVILLSDT